MLAGSMMMPEPIMFTATMNVSCTTFIFFLSDIPLLPHHVGVKLDTTVHLLLIHALHFVVEAGKAVERFLERRKVIEHGLRPVVPAFTGDQHADAGWIDERERRGDAPLDGRVERNVVHLVR